MPLKSNTICCHGNVRMRTKRCGCIASRPVGVHNQRMRALHNAVMDKRELGPVFRERLQTLIQRAAVTRSAFAQSIGVDRSALTQLLSGQSTRLPRADTLRRISERYAVSLDWLLGLSQDETTAAEIKPALEIAVAEPGGEETLIERWHK